MFDDMLFNANQSQSLCIIPSCEKGRKSEFLSYKWLHLYAFMSLWQTVDDVIWQVLQYGNAFGTPFVCYKASVA